MADTGRRSPTTTIPEDTRDVIREVFLSPRVVDREAFNDFSASLRRLIDEAAQHRTALTAASEAATGAQHTLRETLSKHQPRLEAAVRALGALDQRAQDAERALSAARDTASGLEALRVQVHELVDHRRDELARRVSEEVSAAEARLTDILERAEAAARARFDAMETRASEAGAKLEALLARVSDAVGRLGEHADTRAQHAEARLTRKMSELEAWSSDLLRRTEQRVNEEHLRAVASGQELIRQTADAHAQAESITAELSVLLARGEALAGESTPGSLGALIKTAASARADAEQAAGAYQAAIDRAREAREALSAAMAQHAEQLDHCSTVSEALRDSVERTLRVAQTARADLDRRRQEFQVAAAEPVVHINAMGDEIRGQLMDVLQRVEQQRLMADSARAQMAEVIQRGAALVDRLDPWRPLLDGPPDQLPAPAAELVARIRTELSSDLKAMATAMNDLSTRASRAAQGLDR